MEETKGGVGTVVKEGFICPICHKDMRSPNNLLGHFQELHSEEQDLLRSLKGTFFFCFVMLGFLKRIKHQSFDCRSRG